VANHSANHAAIMGGPIAPASIRRAQSQGHAFPTTQARIWHRTCKHDTIDLSFGRKPQPSSALSRKGVNDVAARKQRLTPNICRKSLRMKHRTFRNPFRRKRICTDYFFADSFVGSLLFQRLRFSTVQIRKSIRRGCPLPPAGLRFIPTY